MVLDTRFKYIFHYDELTWMPGVLERPFNQMTIPFDKRSLFINWLKNYTTEQVYIWPGMVSPKSGQSNWGKMIAPTDMVFIIFESNSDQTRFALEFVGNPVGMSAHTFKNGVDAFYSLTR